MVILIINLIFYVIIKIYEIHGIKIYMVYFSKYKFNHMMIIK